MHNKNLFQTLRVLMVLTYIPKNFMSKFDAKVT